MALPVFPLVDIIPGVDMSDKTGHECSPEILEGQSGTVKKFKDMDVGGNVFRYDRKVDRRVDYGLQGA